MTLVKMDQKGRLRLPERIRRTLKLKGREVFDVSLKDGKIEIEGPSVFDVDSDSVLRGMIERPLRSRVRITTELLNKMREEQWSA